MGRAHFWLGLEKITVSGDFVDTSQEVTQLCNIGDHVFVLHKSHLLYHGSLTLTNNAPPNLVLNQTSLEGVDIACNSLHLFLINLNGQPYKISPDNLDSGEEIVLQEESKSCIHGYHTAGHKVRVRSMAAGESHFLYVTESGQLWASGQHPALGVSGPEPRLVPFFEKRVVRAAVCGADFSLALVYKPRRLAAPEKDDTGSESGSEEDVFVSTCPSCISESTPASQQSLTPDRCPLGLHVRQISEDRYSSSTASRDNTADDKKSTDESTSVSGKDETVLKDKASSQEALSDDPATAEQDTEAGDSGSAPADGEDRRNEFFINTDAARQFLTRQLSWVSSYGGAGEELLVDCAEAAVNLPTRIIKQNVSSMASLVYEGVKNVGDRVATLSRHMSGGSEETNESRRNGDLGESFEELNCEELNATASITSSLRGEDFPWSSSACTSERGDESELGVTERAAAIGRSGAALLAVELWAWGGVSRGQLGTGDMSRRHRPAGVARLAAVGVRDVAAGAHHAAAVALDGRAFAWGANGSGQVSVGSTEDQSSPQQMTGVERARFVATAARSTLFVSNEGNLYALGRRSGTHTPAKELIKLHVPPNDKQDPTIWQKQIFSSNRINMCVSRSQPISAAVQDLSIEQTFLEEALLVHSTLIKQLHKRDNISESLASECNVYETLCRCYTSIVNFTAANIGALSTFTERGGDASAITMVASVEEHVRTYRAYLGALCDVVVLSGVGHIARSVDIGAKVMAVFADRLPLKKNKKTPEAVVLYALHQPLNRLNIYKCMIHSLLRCNSSKEQSEESKAAAEKRLNDALAKWDRLWEEQEQRKKEADATRLFWETSGRLVELLRTPERRLVRESRSHPLSLVNSGRFSSHWFVLLSDVLVHVNGSTQTVHPIATVWVESVQDTDAVANALMLTMPEDSLTLSAPTATEKSEWIKTLQAAVNRALHKTPSHKPPAVRTATYRFMKNVTYRDATYVGRWSSARLHGNGKMEWTDGRCYVGKFAANVQAGFGRMEMPNVGVYEGEWKEGMQNGYGVMKYSNGDVYEGSFKDGLPHGHGVRKQGHFMASIASVYIGEWVNGVKQGYGVIDDIITGEKYLGNWSNNLKNGCGLIVTLDGIYYEGNFLQDSLSGYGIMVFEDGTHYEGDFKGVGLFNGKGTLTFVSGDRIEGTLHGAWNEGVKIAGTLHKNTATAPTQLKTNPISFGHLCVPAELKWKAVFRQCYLALGHPEPGTAGAKPAGPADTQKVWDNVAVLISNSHRETLTRPKPVAARDTSLGDKLDTIPTFGREILDANSYRELRQYLAKAFESMHHPLGRLLTETCAAYTATYGGVRVHPLLLSHAVAELHSLTDRVYVVVCLLFPALPPPGDELVLAQNDVAEVSVSAAALLHPVLLPRVHSALFVLYALHNKQEDDAYWKRLLRWNKQPDVTLMAFLGIDQKFWLSYAASPHSPRHIDAGASGPVRLHPFSDAVEMLQQLKTTFSPLEKLHVIRSTFQLMTRAVQAELGTAYLWSMDDLFPVFHFVVVRSQILQLGSEIHFVEDFMEPCLQNGELGIMFTTLKACYYQILQEKVSMSL